MFGVFDDKCMYIAGMLSLYKVHEI